MWKLWETALSLLDGIGLRRVARLEQKIQGGHEEPESVDGGQGYGDVFISRMIQFSQMPRMRLPRDRSLFPMRPISPRPAT